MSKLVKVLYTHITRFQCHISIQKTYLSFLSDRLQYLKSLGRLFPRNYIEKSML